MSIKGVKREDMNKKELNKMKEYWESERITCKKISLPESIEENDFTTIWQTIGMPEQDWWLFNFIPPSDLSFQTEGYTKFCKIGDNWQLYWDNKNDKCILLDHEKKEHYANTSFMQFLKCLIAFDKGCKRIQRECPGDSGEDWDLGDDIIEEMEKEMRNIDLKAFEIESNFWPCMIIDISG